MTALHPGMPDRARPMWDMYLHYQGKESRGWGKAFHAVYEEDGTTTGYVNYRIRFEEAEGEGMRLRVGELIGLTPAAYAALWRFVLDIDLVGPVTAPMRPVDDPVWWMLEDPRRLSRRRGDAIWLRLVDVADALSRRTYAVEGRLVMEVADEYFTSAGRYELDGGPEGARCVHGRVGEPDLVMGVAQLGAAYFGGASFTEQARAGLIEERTPGALANADLMFSTERPPWCPVDF
jgi:predicted acetyltransferase